MTMKFLMNENVKFFHNVIFIFLTDVERLIDVLFLKKGIMLIFLISTNVKKKFLICNKTTCGLFEKKRKAWKRFRNGFWNADGVVSVNV